MSFRLLAQFFSPRLPFRLDVCFECTLYRDVVFSSVQLLELLLPLEPPLGTPRFSSISPSSRVHQLIKRLCSLFRAGINIANALPVLWYSRRLPPLPLSLLAPAVSSHPNLRCFSRS